MLFAIKFQVQVSNLSLAVKPSFDSIAVDILTDFTYNKVRKKHCDKRLASIRSFYMLKQPSLALAVVAFHDNRNGKFTDM